jgi:DNA-binding SARP family transcriptional activator
MTRAIIEIRLFGQVTIYRAGEPITGLETGKVQELLCYLLLHRDRAHSRDVLADTLWGDHPTARAKKYLRQALWQLQTVLKPLAGSTAGRLLHVAADHVAVKAGAELWVDVAAFEEAFARVEDVPDRQLDAERAARLDEAVRLYRGELLGGYYQDWCLRERERLQGLYLAMLDKLMAYAESRRQYETAIGYGACALRCDPAREQTYQRLMVLHYRSGNRTEALRQYQRCVAALRQELDVEPAERTVELYEQIRADRAQERSAALDLVEREAAPPDARPLSPGVALQRLRALMTELASGMTRVEQELRALEQSLDGSAGRAGRQSRTRAWPPIVERGAADRPPAASDA